VNDEIDAAQRLDRAVALAGPDQRDGDGLVEGGLTP